MDYDDPNEGTRQFGTLSMNQTLTAPLNNTVDFLVCRVISLEYSQTSFLLLRLFL